MHPRFYRIFQIVQLFTLGMFLIAAIVWFVAFPEIDNVDIPRIALFYWISFGMLAATFAMAIANTMFLRSPQ